MPIPEFVVALRRHVGQTPLWLPGVTAVVVRTGPGGADEVLLIHRADTEEWAPVTGIVEPGQEVAEAASREVWEEASIVASAERLVWVSTGAPVTHANGDRAQYIDHTFRMRYVSGEPGPGDDETTDARWFAVDDLPAMRAVFADRVAVVLEDAPECRLGPLAR